MKKKARILCNVCALKYIDGETVFRFPWEHEDPAGDPAVLVCSNWEDRVMPNSLLYKCEDCEQLVCVAPSSLWLLGQAAHPGPS